MVRLHGPVIMVRHQAPVMQTALTVMQNAERQLKEERCFFASRVLTGPDDQRHGVEFLMREMLLHLPLVSVRSTPR